MLSVEQEHILESAFERGQNLHDQPLVECLSSLNGLSSEILINLAVLGEALTFDEMRYFLEISEIVLSYDEFLTWLVTIIELNLIRKIKSADDNQNLWQVPDEVSAYFSKHVKNENLKRYHQNADKFILERLVSFASSVGIDLPDEETKRFVIIGPNGFLDQISHLPQHQRFHNGILNLAINWFDHLFCLEKYKEAADILNSICFAIARRGQRKMAQNMLAAVASKTKGLTEVIAKINLATLLREEQQNLPALQLYWRIIPKLLGQRAFGHLAQVLTEMAAIDRQLGNLVRSAFILEFSVMLNSGLKNEKSAAIAHSQLASTYRFLKKYSLAIRNSVLAVEHFRKADDLLNLGRSLLTQGNIYYNQSKTDAAIQCFDEALKIGKQIADPQAEIGSTSGKARVFLLL